MEREISFKRDSSHLLNLPHDILHIVCAQLQSRAWLPLITVSRFEDHFSVATFAGRLSETPLLNLSLTCKALRQVCLPRIFIFVYLYDQALDNSLRSIFVHTRRVLVDGTPENFSAFMNLAPNIREAYFRQSAPVLSPVLHSDDLEVIATSNARSFQQCLPLGNVRASLRVLRVCVSDRQMHLSDIEAELTREKAWLEALLPQIRSTLEVLVVPAESTRFSLLAAAPWPRLCELVLYGTCTSFDVSLLRVFDMMPNLRAFSFIAALRYSQPSLLVCPKNATEIPAISRLRRFTMSSPSAEDRIFTHLPAELEELSLRDSPRFYERSRYPNSGNTIDEYFRPGVPKCGDALSIFKTLSCAALVHLELVVIEDDRELDLLAHIAGACPRLAFLEFHCYRNVSEYDDLLNEPLLFALNDVACVLSAFTALRDVRLNLDTPWIQSTASPYYSPRSRDSAGASRTIAQVIAQAVPWLDTVTILTRDNTRLPEWVLWSVHDLGGVVDIERIVVKHPGDYYKTIDI